MVRLSCPRLISQFWLLGVVVATLAVSIRAQAQSPEGSLKKVKFAIPVVGVSVMPEVLAKELGYYRQEGFDTEIILMRGGLTTQALVAGSVDYTGTTGGTIAAAVQGIKVMVLMAYDHKPLYDLVARPEVSSYADLKGKRFGVASLSGLSFEIPRVMLSRNGLDPKRDVTMVLIGTPDDRLTALRSNAIQATVLDPPYNFRALKEGFRKLDFSGDYIQTVFSSITTSEQKIKTNPDEVSRFVRATARGFLAYRDQRDVAISSLQRFTKLRDRELAQQVYDFHRSTLTVDGTISDDLMRTIIDTQRQAAGVTRPVALEEVFNFSFVRAAMRDISRR